MMREMRRFKQLLPDEMTRHILDEATNVVIGVNGDDGYPYTVPVSHAVSGDVLYFHCAKEGYKVDAIRNNPKVCFSAVVKDEIIPEEFTTYFRSVSGFGKARIVEDAEERMKAFRVICEKFSMPAMHKFEEIVAKEGHGALIVAIDIEHLTGKEAIELVRKRNNEG